MPSWGRLMLYGPLLLSVFIIYKGCAAGLWSVDSGSSSPRCKGVWLRDNPYYQDGQWKKATGGTYVKATNSPSPCRAPPKPW